MACNIPQFIKNLDKEGHYHNNGYSTNRRRLVLCSFLMFLCTMLGCTTLWCIMPLKGGPFDSLYGNQFYQVDLFFLAASFTPFAYPHKVQLSCFCCCFGFLSFTYGPWHFFTSLYIMDLR